MDELLLKPCPCCGAAPQCTDYGGLQIVRCSCRATKGDTNCLNATGKTLEAAVAAWNDLPPQPLEVVEPLRDRAARVLGPQGSRRRPRSSGRIPTGK